MWVRKRIDIRSTDHAFGLFSCLIPANRQRLAKRVEQKLRSDDAVACLSVRSGFDLVLSELELPAESEVLFSAITIPDMVKIVESHGQVAVPIDLDPHSLAPQLEALERAVTSKTRVLIVAHLFGGRMDMDPIIEFARQHNLLVVEDCAQAFDGGEYLGHPESDIVMFSFGPIKTSTALGGALIRIPDQRLRDRVRRAQAEYPVQRRRTYFGRLIKYLGLRIVSMRPIYTLMAWIFGKLGISLDRVANGSVRGFSGPNFFRRIRRQPSAPLLAMMLRRISRFSSERLELRADNGRFLADQLENCIPSPGHAASPHSFWLVPIVVDNPQLAIEILARHGFDATQGQSLCVVQPPTGREERAALEAQELMSKIIFLPCYADMPKPVLEQLAKALLEHHELHGYSFRTVETATCDGLPRPSSLTV